MAKNVVAEASVVIKSDTKELLKDLRNATKRLFEMRRALGATERENRQLRKSSRGTAKNFTRAARSTKKFKRSLISTRAVMFTIERGSFRIWRSMTTGIGRAIRMARNFLLILTGIGAAITGFALKKAAEFETVQVQLAVLTGSSKKAAEQMRELEEFSARTPFQFKEIADAAKNFELMGGAVLNTMENLRFFGDAAAFAKEGFNFADVALWVGRLHSELERGSRAIGKVTLGLMRAGVLSGQARGEMERLAKAGAAADKIWKVMTDDMSRFSGGMERLSKTLNGLYSTLKDNVILAFKALGDELKPIAKFWMDLVIKKLQKLRDDGSLTQWSKKVAEVFKSVTIWLLKFFKWFGQNWETIWTWAQKTFKSFGMWLVNNAEMVVLGILGWYGMMIPGVKSIVTGVVAVLAAFAGGNIIGNLFDSKVIRLHLESAFMPLVTLPNLIIIALEESWSHFKRFFARLAEGFSAWNKTVEGILTSDFGLAKKGFLEFADVALTQLMDVGETINDVGQKWIDDVAMRQNEIAEEIKKLGNPSLWSELKKAIEKIPGASAAKKKIKEIADTIRKGLKDISDTQIDIPKFKGFEDNVEGFAHNMKRAAEAAKEIKNTMSFLGSKQAHRKMLQIFAKGGQVLGLGGAGKEELGGKGLKLLNPRRFMEQAPPVGKLQKGEGGLLTTFLHKDAPTKKGQDSTNDHLANIEISLRELNRGNIGHSVFATQ
jgi:hypothetical protein